MAAPVLDQALVGGPAAIAPIVGTARIASATGNIVRALAFTIETVELEDED